MNTIRKIPTEVLEEIFFLAIDGPISNTQKHNFPWAIGRVCKSWRSAFVNHPDLWTWIAINLAESRSREQDLNAANQYLPLCLDRSGNYPLNISFHLPTEDFDESQPFALLWHSFLSCSHRWRTIHLANAIRPHLVGLNACTGATPILESLTIQTWEIFNQTNVTGFQIAPLLTRFTLSFPLTKFATWRWSFPWMQLTYLMLMVEEIIGVDHLSALFSQLRDIEEFHLILEEKGLVQTIDLGDFIHSPEGPHHVLQRLRVLRLCCVEPLGLITAPSLSELHLVGSEFFYPSADDDDPDFSLATEIFECFTQRSACKIHKLTFSDFSEDDLSPLDDLFPDVEELRVVGAMTYLKPLWAARFPALRVLDIVSPHDIEDVLERLPAMLQSRNRLPSEYSVIPLAKVILRPVREDRVASFDLFTRPDFHVPEDKVASTPLFTALDWKYFKYHVQLGQCCELDLTPNFDYEKTSIFHHESPRYYGLKEPFQRLM